VLSPRQTNIVLADARAERKSLNRRSEPPAKKLRPQRWAIAGARVEGAECQDRRDRTEPTLLRGSRR